MSYSDLRSSLEHEYAYRKRWAFVQKWHGWWQGEAGFLRFLTVNWEFEGFGKDVIDDPESDDHGKEVHYEDNRNDVRLTIKIGRRWRLSFEASLWS